MARELTVAEALESRRTTPRFDPDRPIDPALLVRILEPATRSPSERNLQPWRFLVVRDRANRERLNRCAQGLSRFAEAPVVVIVLAYLHPQRTHLQPIVDEMVDRGILNANEARAFAGRTRSRIDRRADPESWAVRAAMTSAMALVLAAESLGVQSALVDPERLDPDRLRREFGVPDDHALGCLIALGYAVDRRPPPFPGRLPIDAVCFGEHFGRPFDANPDAEERSP